MTRELSGTFRRATRVEASVPITVRLRLGEPIQEVQARLVELGTMDLLLSGIAPVPLGTRLRVLIPLPDRYLEFEVSGMVSWHRDGQFGIAFDHLTLRQTFALVLAIDLMGHASERLPPLAKAGPR